ncbi:MAG TPA: hypothetical protein VHL78_10100 [Actinomycetota bacterium]|nr:hypothetical protein [Actinomycetota bacterium]
MAEARTRSLDVILEEVRIERQAQLRHFDALDAKAGIILGFAGALVALAPAGPVLLDISRFAAALSGFLALSTFWPRGYWAIELRRIRDLYLAAEPTFTRLRILDTQIWMAEELGGVLHSKARRLKSAMGALAISALLTAIGLGLH